MRLRRRGLALGTAAWLASAALASRAQGPDAAAPFPAPDWPRSTPEAEGVDPAALAGLYDYLATPGFHTDSVLVLRHGRIVSEAFVLPYRAGLRHDLRSVTKSVVSTLVGAAIEDGRIRSTGQKLLDFFPQHKAGSPGQAELTLQHLLDMASSIAWRETPYDAESDALRLWASRHWTQFILDKPVANPGRRFQYMAAGPHLLSAVLSRSTGLAAADYARRGLFGTLDIRNFAWTADPQGVSVGESALRLAPRDLAKLGHLLLRGGRWRDRQLLPRDWTQALFEQGLPTGNDPAVAPPFYSRLWWVDRAVPYASALGRYGQHLIVLPRQDLVVVVTSKGTPGANAAARAAEMVQHHLLAAARSDRPLPHNAQARARLAQAVARLEAGNIAPASRTPTAAALGLAARRFVFEPNAHGYLGMALVLDAAPPRWLLLQAGRTPGTALRRTLPIAIDGGFVEDNGWARRGRWSNEDTFLIEAEQLESAITTEWTLRFANDTLEVGYLDADGASFQLRGRPQQAAKAAS